MKEKLRRNGLLALLVLAVAALSALALRATMPCGADSSGTPAILCSTPFSPTSETGSPDEVLVRVNGTEITRSEVDKELNRSLGLGNQQLPEADLKALRDREAPRIQEMLVVRTLLEQAADSEKISVSAADIEQAVEELRAQLPPGTALDDLITKLGLSEEEWTANMKDEVRIRKLIDAHVGRPGQPTEDEIKAFYTENEQAFELPERVEARHILVAVDRDDNDQARAEKKQKALVVRERLTGDEPESFETVAAEVSDCPSATRGGDLGTFGRGQMVPAFEKAAFTQQPGVIGPVVETDFGYHIIKVEDHKKAGLAPLDEVRGRIARELEARKEKEAFKSFINQLRANASIEVVEKEEPA